jgi:hypothetical protein|tara:strand:+ start:85 stop:315 length:231 start_codon:yes stop_codon:yes gene_type:complete
MKVKHFIKCLESLDEEGIDDPYELEMVLHPSVNMGADLIWFGMGYSHNKHMIYFTTKTTLLQEGYSEEVIKSMEEG